jgi:hypothetical protein
MSFVPLASPLAYRLRVVKILRANKYDINTNQSTTRESKARGRVKEKRCVSTTVKRGNFAQVLYAPPPLIFVLFQTHQRPTTMTQNPSSQTFWILFPPLRSQRPRACMKSAHICRLAFVSFFASRHDEARHLCTLLLLWRVHDSLFDAVASFPTSPSTRGKCVPTRRPRDCLILIERSSSRWTGLGFTVIDQARERSHNP